VRFWTLTLPPRYKTATQGYQAIPRMWYILSKIRQREYGQWSYIAFVEGQPLRGFMPHFHVITFNHIPKGDSKRTDPLKWIKDMAVRVGFGFQATDEIVTGKRASAYVVKYASKGTPDIPKNFRRVRASRNWPRPSDEKTDPYIVRAAAETIDAYLVRVADISGVPVQDIADGYQKADDKMRYERLRIT